MTVVWHVTMSLDGFIAGPGDSLDWMSREAGPEPLGDQVRAATGAILAGRRWYDVATAMYDGREGVYGGAWTGPVLVLTHHPPADPGDPLLSFVNGPLEDALRAAREAAGGRAVEIFGADVARQCLAAGLVDEIVVHVAPVLLGDGVRFHDVPGGRRIALERTALGASGPATDLRFRVVRPG
jgi:dihydrofolate reductase